jgi:hypothetical protein
MKKYARILVAVTFLLGFSVAANAEMRAQVIVKLPFAFVASGVTLPAGTYTVKRFSQQPFDTLILTSDDKGTSVFIHPVEMENATGDTSKVSFHWVGEQHFLSAIETPDYIYNFTVSKSVLLEAAAKQRDVVAAPSSGGSK